MPDIPRRKHQKYVKPAPKIITASTLLRVRDTFTHKGWPIIDTHVHSTFQRYCTMIAQLEEGQEQDLLFELTNRFYKIDYEDYDKYLIYSVNNIYRDIPCKRIHICPLLAPQDEGKLKSSVSVAYRFKGDKLKTLPYYKGQYLITHDNVNLLPDILQNDDILLLVDDFIGTGETAMCAVENLLTLKPAINQSKIILLSLVSLDVGVKFLEKKNLNVYSTSILYKGISDYYSHPESKSYLDIMSKIESRMKVFEQFKLGYGQSEALVSMIRTPNNTLPIFWLNAKLSSAPFPRD